MIFVALGVLRERSIAGAVSATVGPFVTLGIVVLAGWLSVRTGVFDALSSRLISPGSSPTRVVVAVLASAALLSGIVNLDVAVVVVMPIALLSAGALGVDGVTLSMGVASIANASSFLLPTSNITSLLVLGSAAGTARFVSASWLAWSLVAATSVGVWTWLVGRRSAGHSAPDPGTYPGRAWSLGRIASDLGAMFLISLGLRTLVASGLHLAGGFGREAAMGSLLAAASNNLPAASVVRPGPAGPWPAILAMAIGPNLILTGSVATVICRRFAREAGSDLPVVAYSIAGLGLVPLQLGVAHLGLRLTGAV